MPVPVESLTAGKCYIAEGGRVWRIVRIWSDGRVQYEARARHISNAKAWKPSMLTVIVFAATVEREVPCDWTPGTDE